MTPCRQSTARRARRPGRKAAKAIENLRARRRDARDDVGVIVVGGIAAVAQGTPVVTFDVDIADRLGPKSSAGVPEVVLAFFPPERLPVRAQEFLEEMFDDCV